MTNSIELKLIFGRAIVNSLTSSIIPVTQSLSVLGVVASIYAVLGVKLFKVRSSWVKMSRWQQVVLTLACFADVPARSFLF